MWSAQDIEERNTAYRKLERSVNSMTYHEKCAALRKKLRMLKEHHPKNEKDGILKEVRALGKELGFTLGSYNSSNFGEKV